MQKIKGKKAFLLGEETIKIVIALICILFLAYLLISLYYSKIRDEKSQQAQATLNGDGVGSIKTIIGRVMTNQGNLGGNSERLVIHNPQGWTIFSFFVSNVKPNSCSNSKCICVCDEVSDFSIKALSNSKEERQAEECDENGACLIVPELRKFDNIHITESSEVLIKNDGGITLT